MPSEKIARAKNEGDGWRCMECGYFHRADPTYEKVPARCENCDVILHEAVDPNDTNPFEPSETSIERSRRVGRMIRENVDRRLKGKS